MHPVLSRLKSGRLSMRTRLLLLVLVALLPASGGIAWLIVQQREQARAAAYAQVRGVADGIAAQITSVLSNSETMLERLAERPSVRALDPRRCDPIFKDHLLLRRESAALVLRDRQGNLICASDPELAPAYSEQAVQLDWLRDAIAANGFAVSGARRGLRTGRWVSILTAPVRDTAGEIRGLLVLGIDLLKLQDRLIQSAPPGAFVTVFDRDHRFLLRSVEPDRWLGQPLPAPQLADIKDRDETYFASRNLQGVALLWSHIRLPGAGWGIAVGMPEDVVLAASRAELRRSLAVGIGTLLAMLGLTWFIARPIRALARTSARIIAGETSARAPLEGPAEIEALAAHFNRLLDERERTLDVLRRSEERFALATRGSSDGFWDWNIVTGESFYSDRFCELLGYVPGELKPDVSTWHQLLHPEDLERTLRASQAHQERAEVYDVEYRLRTKAGAYRWFRARGRAVRNDAGLAIRMAGSIVDITERKSAEDAIRRLNAELEQRVQERTAKLAAVNRELETFNYSVAHDLKAPLRGIDGYSRLLLDGYADRLDDEGRQFLRNVRLGTQQMNRLLDDLLAYSRLERLDSAVEPVDLRALLESLLAAHAGEVAARAVAVEVAVPMAAVNAEREGLTMALRNLIGNAFKFTRDAPQPAIEIGARAQGAGFLIWVRDNGIGFDMQYHDRIFEIFQRLQRAEDYPGTGVGLAIVKKAVQRMGGRAWAESEPGKGATFYVEVPG